MVPSLRILVVITVTALTSGIPHVLAVALDDDCCTQACDGSLDGKRCPPNCDRGACAKVHAAVTAIAAPTHGVDATFGIAITLAQLPPALPLVTSGLFHPPRA